MARPRADSWQETPLPVHAVPGTTHTRIPTKCVYSNLDNVNKQ